MLLFEVRVYMYMYCTAGNFSSGENFHHFHHLLLLVIEIYISAIQKKKLNIWAWRNFSPTKKIWLYSITTCMLPKNKL